MGLGGTCHDYARALEEGRAQGLSDREIDRRYSAEHEFNQRVLIPLLKSAISEHDNERGEL